MVHSDSIAIDHRNVRGIDRLSSGWRGERQEYSQPPSAHRTLLGPRRAIVARSSAQRNDLGARIAGAPLVAPPTRAKESKGNTTDLEPSARAPHMPAQLDCPPH